MTIKEIALQLGLSNSTVSRALRDSYLISEPIRKKVQAYASMHQYRPNLNALRLKNKHGRTVGVSVASISNIFFSEIISGIESAAYEKGYQIILTQSMEKQDREARNIELLEWHAVDGLLISLSAETEGVEMLRNLQRKGTHVVMFDRTAAGIDCHRVCADNVGGAEHAVRHLLERGRRRIAFVGLSQRLEMMRDRLEGYRSALRQAGIEDDHELIFICDAGEATRESAEELASRILSMPDRPDALFTASESLSIQMLHILHQRGLRVPVDLAVAGFSNFKAPELFNPELTTVSQPAFEMGRTAMELLIASIESRRPLTSYQHIILPTALHVRASS
jgi:LacI family transcriptional regulator